MITYSDLGRRGRLGNQLFQIASTIGIATANGHEYVFPSWSYSSCFHLSIPQLPQSELVKYNWTQCRHTLTEIDVRLDKDHDWNLQGFYQSWRHFDHCKPLIKCYFTTASMHYKITVDACAIHVRRGDYLNRNSILTVQPMEYFKRAIERFPVNTNFLVFSDDIAWCKEQFLGNRFCFSESKDEITDLSMMIACSRGHIISNSTFSWWGAWLSDSPIKVAPPHERWFVNKRKAKHIIPPDWITLTG